ncbi:FAS-associated death domain protein-like [Glandiceps talaboti]
MSDNFHQPDDRTPLTDNSSTSEHFSATNNEQGNKEDDKLCYRSADPYNYQTQDIIQSDSIDGANAKPVIDPFCDILYQVSKEITDDKFKEMKFLLQMNIPNADSEKILQPYELFTKMKELGIIRPTDTKVLVDLLNKIGRKDLGEKINAFEFHKTNLTVSKS